MARPLKPSVTRSFRLSAELWERIELRVAEMNAADSSMRYMAVDAVREALDRALPPLPVEGTSAGHTSKRSAKPAKGGAARAKPAKTTAKRRV